MNYNRHILFDEYIKPLKKITNYLEHVTNLDSFKIGRAQTIGDYLPRLKLLF